MKQLILQYRGLKREIYILFIGKLVTAMGSFVWPMLTFFFTKKLGFSDGLSTLLIAIASVLSFPAALLGGKLADKYSRKAIIILFDCLTFLFYALAAILPITVFTAALLFLASLFQTIESPAYDALNADYSTSKQREKAYSLSYLGFNLGFIAGASFSGILFQNHIQLGFLLNGCAVITSTILIFFFVHKKNAITACKEELSENYSQYEQPVGEKLSVIQIFRQRPVVFWVLVISCFASMPSNLVGILLPLQLKEGLGNAGAAMYGYLNSLNGFVVVLFTPHSDSFAEKVYRAAQIGHWHSAFRGRHRPFFPWKCHSHSVYRHVYLYPWRGCCGFGQQPILLPPHPRISPGKSWRIFLRFSLCVLVPHPICHQFSADHQQ